MKQYMIWIALFLMGAVVLQAQGWYLDPTESKSTHATFMGEECWSANTQGLENKYVAYDGPFQAMDDGGEDDFTTGGGTDDSGKLNATPLDAPTAVLALLFVSYLLLQYRRNRKLKTSTH